MSETKIMEALAKAVIDGNEEAARKAAAEAINENVDPIKAIKEGLAKGMSIIGEKFHKFEVFLPHVMLSADAMKEAVSLLEKNITAEKKSEINLGKVVIGTVRQDLHDIGKNLVAMMMEGAGFTITDLGVDVSPQSFVQKAEEVGADILAMSALLSTTMPAMRETIAALEEAGMRKKVKVMIGGAPVTENFAREIKADSYAPDAGSAVIAAKKLVNPDVS